MAESIEKLAIPEGAIDGFASVLWVQCSKKAILGEARANGARHSHASLVAFAENQAFPEPEWAQAMIDAHRVFAVENLAASAVVSRAFAQFGARRALELGKKLFYALASPLIPFVRLSR